MSDSNKFPTDFVPVSRLLVEELGYQAAYVFGIVWNYCQMEDKTCKAAHETIANRAGMSRRSVITHLDELIKAGYIEDLTPEVRNEPHQLCTKKGVQFLHTKERIIKEEKPAEEPERYAKSAHQNNGGMQKLPSGYAKSAQLGMQNLHKKRQSQETSLKEVLPKGNSGKPPAKNKDSPPVSVLAYRSVANRFPDKAIWPVIAEAVGDNETDLQFWKEVVTAWIARGYRKINIDGMLDWFRNREIPKGKDGRKTSQPKNKQPAAERGPISPEEWKRMVEST